MFQQEESEKSDRMRNQESFINFIFPVKSQKELLAGPPQDARTPRPRSYLDFAE